MSDVLKLEKPAGGPRQNLTERIYRQLKQRIFDFDLLPGDRFSENEMAEQMQASRTPVREALMRLQREGFVEVSFRSGWQVRPFDFQQYEQLYDVRIVLEQAAVKRLSDMQPGPELEELKQTWLVAQQDRLADGPALSALDERFHQQLVQACGNAEMARIHHDLTERLRIVRRFEFTKPQRLAVTYDEHASILRAILARRGDEAQRLLKAHIEESKAAVRQITLHMLFEARQSQNHSPPA